MIRCSQCGAMRQPPPLPPKLIRGEIEIGGEATPWEVAVPGSFWADQRAHKTLMRLIGELLATAIDEAETEARGARR